MERANGTKMTSRQPWAGPLALTVLVVFGAAGLRPTPHAIAARAKAAEADYKSKLGMAQLFEGQEQPDKAGEIYRELIKSHPKEAEPRHLLAVMESKQGHAVQAEESFKKALALAPADSEVLNDYGSWLYLNNRLDESEKLFRTCLEINPTHKKALNNLAKLVGRRGRFDESFALFNRCGTAAEAHANIASVYAQVGRFDEARRHYQHALELEPSMKAAAEGIAQLTSRDADPAVTPASTP